MTETSSRQHHEVTFTPMPAQVEAVRELLVRCAAQVTRQPGVGPSSWCASFDEARQVFLVEAYFPSQSAALNHMVNLQGLLKEFAPLLAAPPQTVIRHVFASAF